MSKTVLIVDDSSSIRRDVRNVLQRAGYAVVEASDGRDGADKIAADTDIALVLCDVHMPRMTGVEMVVSVKGEARNQDLPIVMLTAESDPKMIERARSAGVKGWMVKPVKPDLLVAAVRKLIGP